MSEAKAIWLQFMQHLATCEEGADFQIGEMYDPVEGWRCYLKVGDKAMAMNAEGARQMANHYEQMARRPEWAEQKAWADDTVKTLREAARVCIQKNRDKIVPPGYAEAMPTAGQA